MRDETTNPRSQLASHSTLKGECNGNKAPIEIILPPPTLLTRYACASILIAVFAVWGTFAFIPQAEAPGVTSQHLSYKGPLVLTAGYLISLPLLRWLVDGYISKVTDTKLLLKESMILYNVGQVVLNFWMVYRFIDAIVFRGHPFIGNIDNVTSGATFAIWVHYCDKYLEFLDTYFMILRGRMDQVSFLHVYHHTTIAWAWWAGISLSPGGDAYFGALLNSWIHVMMYSYYALSLLKIQCPWKKYLTMAQLLQFSIVNVYTICSWWKIRDIAYWNNHICYAIQMAEMTSLFVLFWYFYKKTYSAKKRL